MDRNEALDLVKREIGNANLIKHTLAVEAVMRRCARRLGAPEERWGLSGLLHDIDYSKTANDPDRHSLLGAEMLSGLGLDEELVAAVKSHNDRHGIPRETLMAKALYAADPLTGLIVAAALIHPHKKLSAIDVAFLQNRFGEKSFARGARRDAIESCGEVGLTLQEFLGLGLEAMQGIAAELGL